jgi:hypothetical protein
MKEFFQLNLFIRNLFINISILLQKKFDTLFFGTIFECN